uniref:Uncharacterized protein n=1 Tax=Chromera velia CCMP2878 TaxID=1169474 RepID=A0A0G4I5Y7_9ALVE|eukprot:Cvel_11259.t1-p1 / transcript=Cvel_11259.t1 / gene=Cvel_11259 / organism=Chromera_velia_CCMP2878 / gene_product=hypothetical protein / transcript_product=hypothetical protein / location=Cvel_scaffold702:18139-18348(+) / protein_length=70 / sequence_SO=supercontig / SO=protein_coding / is_pseudo=false
MAAMHRDRRGMGAAGGTTGRRTTENFGEKRIRGSPFPDPQMTQQPNQQPPHVRPGGRSGTQMTRPALVGS